MNLKEINKIVTYNLNIPEGSSDDEILKTLYDRTLSKQITWGYIDDFCSTQPRYKYGDFWLYLSDKSGEQLVYLQMEYNDTVIYRLVSSVYFPYSTIHQLYNEVDEQQKLRV